MTNENDRLEEILNEFGVPPAPNHRNQIREMLVSLTKIESEMQGHGNAEVMKLLCVYLFAERCSEDILTIWRAKSASMDTQGYIGVQLLCGTGIEETIKYLRESDSPEAARALKYLEECVKTGDFEDFDFASELQEHQNYYTGDQ